MAMARRRGATTRPARSAFAAAFLSLLFPGLGHAYIGRWVRAALWAVLPIIGIAAVAGLFAGPSRTDVLTRLADPDVLVAALGFIGLDLLYRMLAVIDAWRLGRDRTVGSGLTRSASTLGLTAVALVLVVSHLAVAQPILVAQDILGTFDGGGDTSPLPDVSELSPELRDLVALEAPSSAPGADPGHSEAPTDEPTLEPWTGEERLDILLVGIDSGRQGQPTYLTDTMMVVSIDPGTGRLALISLPRDTVGVPLPERFGKARAVYGTRYGGRINTLYVVARQRPDLFPGNDAQRGYKALMGALSELYDLDIGYYVSVDLSGFRGAVNALSGEYDGIIVDVDTPLRVLRLPGRRRPRTPQALRAAGHPAHERPGRAGLCALAQDHFRFRPGRASAAAGQQRTRPAGPRDAPGAGRAPAAVHGVQDACHHQHPRADAAATAVAGAGGGLRGAQVAGALTGQGLQRRERPLRTGAEHPQDPPGRTERLQEGEGGRGRVTGRIRRLSWRLASGGGSRWWLEGHRAVP